MIHSIKANKQSFKTINFTSGFNVILSDRQKEATDKDSRNGLGKSTLIEIIHFCLGAKIGKTLSKKQLADWTFTLEMDLIDKKYSISRNTSDSNKIIIEGDCTSWPIQPEKTIDGYQFFSNSHWIDLLGVLLFDLQLTYDVPYTPTSRSLLSYFIRRNGQIGGFLSPFTQFRQQAEWDKQVNNTYLLGLGWEFASQWQILKDKEQALEQINKATASEVVSELVGNLEDLETTKIRLDAQIRKEEENLKDFKVHEQYKQIQTSSNSITQQIHEFLNQNVSDKRLLEYYDYSLTEENDASAEKVIKIYEEAGLIFHDTLAKKLDEVLEFHEQIVKNRKNFLTSEIKRLGQNIMNREEEIQRLDSKRAEFLVTLRTHGALDEYTHLQANHQRLIGLQKDISLRLENLKKFEQGSSQIAIEKELLYQKAEADLDERQEQRENAILVFNSYSEKLYEVPGNLSIGLTKNGYRFNIKIQRSESHGFESMKIFCYDLMLSKLWAKKKKSLRLLIHDSVLFADVDERQKAKALQLAEFESRNEGFQYICTMNSDTIPKNDFKDNFDLDNYVRAKFTDAKEDGGLLGIRF